VLIYRDVGTAVDAKLELRRLQQAAAERGPRCRADDAMSLLIGVGEFEAALADALPVQEDAIATECSRARDASLAAARLWLRARRETFADTGALSAALDRLAGSSLPARITHRVSEGFAYYALFPEGYLLAAERYVLQQQPASAAVLGIRSIGTTLSAVVAATFESHGCRTTSWTVRPGGHPFDRRLRLSTELAMRLGECAADGACFAIVDEGPGLSGSSFAAVVDALEALGIASSRIALFPSWDADPDRLRSSRAQSVWRTHQRCCVGAREAGIGPERAFGIDDAVEDWSGGLWRESQFGPETRWPAVQPQHERWKVLVGCERRVIRFAGLGRYGDATALRARTLFDAGLGGRPGTLAGGFLDLPFVAGTPIVSGTVTASDAAAMGRYVGCLSRIFAGGVETSEGVLMPMLETNVAELLGISGGLPAFVPGPLVHIDGRMLAHEWLRTEDGLRKIDALDHHNDHFFPGPTDSAWDLAGAAIELALDETAECALLDAYARASGDASVAARLPFYRAAYAAFRGGYCAMQAAALEGTREGERFARARDGYAAALRRAIGEHV
jgi:hypothetical protein